MINKLHQHKDFSKRSKKGTNWMSDTFSTSYSLSSAYHFDLFDQADECRTKMN